MPPSVTHRPVYRPVFQILETNKKVPKFLNRMLAMSLRDQKMLFAFFSDTLVSHTLQARPIAIAAASRACCCKCKAQSSAQVSFVCQLKLLTAIRQQQLHTQLLHHTMLSHKCQHGLSIALLALMRLWLACVCCLNTAASCMNINSRPTQQTIFDPIIPSLFMKKTTL